jgi:hypothetical protein
MQYLRHTYHDFNHIKVSLSSKAIEPVTELLEEGTDDDDERPIAPVRHLVGT